tara:strand:+ start:266 stop:715 length:450 start_codon:yes stop_codon:yes gene_type:complete
MSTIIIDTITGKSTATTVTIGSTPVVSASANSMTIRGEGTAQTSIQQGLAKQWCSATIATNTHTIQGSFNVASLTDDGVGKTDVVFTTAMADDDYAITACSSVNGDTIFTHLGVNTLVTTTHYRTNHANEAGSEADYDNSGTSVHGDLA